MTSTTSYFTKSLPKRGDIMGSPDQMFNMNSTRKGYYHYILGGITAGTIVAIGTLSHESNNFIYLFATQIHCNLGGKPLGIVDNASNKMGEISCVYIKLTDLKYFPYIKSTTTMGMRLKHTKVTLLDPEHLKFTKDFKGFTDPLRGTLLPVFFFIYFGQDIPQGSIASDEEKSALAKLGLGYGLWVEMASKAIDKFNKIKIVMDAYSAIDNMTEEAFYKTHFYGHYDKKNSLVATKGPCGAITTVQSDAYQIKAKAIKKNFLPTPQALPPQVPATASALILQLAADTEKEVVAKTGIHNLRLLHICRKIDQASTTFGDLSYPTLSTGMEVILGQPRASQSSSLYDLVHQTLATAREQDLFSIRSTAISQFHVPKALTGHLLTGNYAICKGGGKAQAAQHSKKARRSGGAADSAKCNVTNIGMFFLHKPDMKAVKIFPKDMPETVCANFTCRGRECTRENCAFKHPRKVGELKKETINAIGNHFLQKGIGWLNKWHFLRVRSELPGELKSLVGGKDGPSTSKKTA
jgi:hypothetical protein